MQRYGAVAGEPLDDDIAITVLIDLGVEKLRESIGVANKDIGHRDARE